MRAGERGGSPAALRGQERHCHRGDGGLADVSVAGSEGRSYGVAPGLFGEGAVPSTEPRRMSGMATAMPSVSGSPRMMTPRRTATSGLTYVITVEREGPTSRISAKNKRKASTVQTSASAATAPTVSAETDAGMESRPAGAYPTAVSASEAVMTPRVGRPARRRLMMSGPVA